MEIYNTKKIGIVYTTWKDGISEPNGYDILPTDYTNPITFFHSHGWFATHLNDVYGADGDNRKFDIIQKRVSDVTDGYTHLYPIAHPNLNYSHFEEYNIQFSKEIINLTHTNKNFYIVFLLEHEPDTESGFLSICNKLERDGFNLSNVILLNNNSKLYNYKEKYNKNVIVHKSFFLNFSSTKVFNTDGSEFITDKDGKFFMTRNRNNRAHRKNLIFDILSSDLKDNVNYSFLNQSEENDPEFGVFKNYQSESDIDKNHELLTKINLMYKECDYEVSQNFIDRHTKEFIHQDRFYNIYLIPEWRPAFENSYFNIVTESCFEQENVIHITEKSLRPFHYYQFPIFLATHGHVAQLKKDYKFDMFDDIINHSYDNEPDKYKRYRMVIDEIHRINNNKDFFIDFYKNNKFRFSLNKEKMHTVGYNCKSLDIDFFWNLCD